MSNLQERAPIGFVQGRDVMITPEWFRNLSQALDTLGGISNKGLTPAQTVALAQVSSLSVSLAALTAQIALLTARVNALDGGFQS